MAQALIRNIDDALLDRYRALARAKGNSLEHELREALRRAEPLADTSADDLKRLSAELRAMTPHEPPQGDSTLIVRWYRDTHGGRWTDDGWADAVRP
jgi:plasmid stability protein